MSDDLWAEAITVIEDWEEHPSTATDLAFSLFRLYHGKNPKGHIMQSWIGLLFWALRTVPAEIAVVQSGVNQHWSADHVVQAQKAIALLSQVVETAAAGDRKSTRLNSSHQIISYAVFCLKKKNPMRATSPRS